MYPLLCYRRIVPNVQIDYSLVGVVVIMEHIVAHIARESIVFAYSVVQVENKNFLVFCKYLGVDPYRG
jgi:hypothetical protein